MNAHLEKAKAEWNLVADKDNQWDSLDSDEKFAQFWKHYDPVSFRQTAKDAWDVAEEEFS